jgi:two-component system cell cycle response regulator
MTARILIVDDVPANARLLELKLTAEYYQVATAADGFAALRQATSWQPDLVLLDVMMPGMDGFEVCQRLKADPATLHIPVVMVTALDEKSERLRGLQCGADDFLTKPVEYDTLLARVRSLVRLKRLLDEWRARGETARALGLMPEELHEPAVKGARALVVDDWAFGAENVQKALMQEGIVPAHARSGVEALQHCAHTPFDLIVISLSMTEDDPLQLASQLRAADRTHDIPLLLLAEPDQRKMILRGFDLGANDWLLRPVDEHELRVRARNQIRRKVYQDRMRADLGQALALALTDPLTGLYNRRYLLRHLGGLLAAPNSYGVAVLMLDVDHFKTVNDRYGHPAGDAALRLVAELLRQRTRVFDSVARYGGEEFVVVMPGVTTQEAMLAAERLREAVLQLRFVPAPDIAHRLTVSIGVAVCLAPVPGASPESLIQAADVALYDAKGRGRNRVELATALI